MGRSLTEIVDFAKGVDRLNDGKDGAAEHPGNLRIGFGIRRIDLIPSGSGRRSADHGDIKLGKAGGICLLALTLAQHDPKLLFFDLRAVSNRGLQGLW